jgi:hypothetical protein
MSADNLLVRRVSSAIFGELVRPIDRPPPPHPTMLKKVLVLVVAMLACASAFMATSRPAVAMQCPAPSVAEPPLFMTATPDFVVASDELDNSAIAEDTNIMPARKCGFCMG